MFPDTSQNPPLALSSWKDLRQLRLGRLGCSHDGCQNSNGRKLRGDHHGHGLGGVGIDVASAKGRGLLLEIRNAGFVKILAAGEVFEDAANGALVEKTGPPSRDQRHAGAEDGENHCSPHI